MDATVGIKTTTGDKIYRHVYYVQSYDGFMYIRYREQGIEKKAIFETAYIVSFAIGGPNE